MTRAEIFALPLQTSTRLGRASDTGQWYVIEAGQTGAQAARVVVEEAIWSVNDAAARKTLATYDPNGPVAGQTRVIQIDTPSIMWCYRGGDATADAAWLGIPFTIDPVGTVVVNMQLADVTGTVPALNVLGVSGGKLRLGDGVTENGNGVEPSDAEIMSACGARLIESLKSVRAPGAGCCHFSTTKPTSGSIDVYTSTGYARLVNPDNTLSAQAGTGNAGNVIKLTIPASGLHRAYGVISVANGGTVASGSLTQLSIINSNLTSFSGEGLSSLTDLTLYNNQLTSFSGEGLSSLTYLTLYNNQLTSFSGEGLSSLVGLFLNGNQLASFSGVGLSALTNLVLGDNQLASFSGVGLSSLTYLTLYNNQLTSFSGEGLSGLTNLTLYSNQLTAVSEIGDIMAAWSFSGYARLDNNNLSAEALNAIFTSLSAVNPWPLNVSNNPGALTCDVSIATAKGWTIITS